MVGLFYKAVPVLADEDKIGGSAILWVNHDSNRGKRVVHRCTGGGEAAYAGFSRELTGLPSLDPSGAVVRSLLVQSFLRKPKDATDTFLSKHVYVREIQKKISRT